MKRIIAAAIVTITLLAPFACATSGGNYDQRSGMSSPNWMIQESSRLTRESAHNPGTN